MMKVILLLAFTGLLCTGCQPHYNITPYYNEKEHTLSINDVIFEDAKQKSNRLSGFGERGGGSFQTQKYEINSRSCFKIYYFYSKAGYNTYFIDSKYDKIIERFSGGSCDVTQISNLKFLFCKKIDNYNNSKERYFITTDTQNEGGYDTLEELSLQKGCFDKIKIKTIEQAKKDKVKIKSYTDRSNLPRCTSIQEYLPEKDIAKKKESLDQERAPEIKTFIEIQEPDVTFFYGEKKYTVDPGDVLKVIRSKKCRSGAGVCWVVRQVSTGETGVVRRSRMHGRHRVYFSTEPDMDSSQLPAVPAP